LRSCPYKTIHVNDTNKSYSIPTSSGASLDVASYSRRESDGGNIFVMRTTAISLVISHSACGVQRTRARRIYRPVLDSFSFILFSLVPLLAFPPSAFNFFFYQPSSSGPSLSFSIALAHVLSLYIQPVDPTNVLRTTSNRPRSGHCASAPLGAPSLSSELFIPHANPVAPSNSVPRCNVV